MTTAEERPIEQRESGAKRTGGNPLAVPAFRYLWLSSLTFFLAANALRFVFGWVVLDGLERDESVQGLVVFMLGLPSIFLLLPAGVWADRFNRRSMLIGTQLATAVVMVVTALMIGAGQLSVTLLIASAVLAGTTTALGSPVRSSLIPEILPHDLLLSGIALNALAMTVSLVVGAVSAQVIGDVFGFDGAFWYLAILLVIGTVALIPMQPPNRTGISDKERPTMGQAVGEGLSFVAGHRALRVLFLLLALAGLVMNALVFVILQVLVKEEFGRDAGDAAPLLAMMGIGMAIASVFIVKRGDMENKGTKFIVAMGCGTVLLVLMGLSTAYWQLFVLCLLMGLAGGFFINMNQGLIQAITPPDLMGRVMGLFTLVSGGLTPVGALLLGLLSSVIGPANTFVSTAGVGVALVVIAYWRADDLHQLQT